MIRRRLLMTCAVLVSMAACHHDPYRGTIELVQVPSPSLAGSVLPNPDTQPALVYLPPAHDLGGRLYPVVYYLPGFTTDPTEYVDQTYQGLHLRVTMDALIRFGRIEPMIVVVPTGRNELGGGFWADSPVTGRWASYVVEDVVPFVDEHYPTLVETGARGIAGDSMGGSGALHLAMTRPGFFGAVYSLSPGLFADEVPIESWMFEDMSRVTADLELVAELAALDRASASRRLREAVAALYAERSREAYFQAFNWAYGAAFAPTTGGEPPLVDYPFIATPNGPMIDPGRRTRWASGFGALERRVARAAPDLASLQGLVLDYGRNDSLTWIPEGCERLSSLLTEAGVPHEVRAHQGTHVGSLRWRIEYEMLPFFSEVLTHDRTSRATAASTRGSS